MKPPKLRIHRETLRLLDAQEAQHAAAGLATLASCRIVSCAFACPTLVPQRCL
ncbi:MAG: hypothetical protein U0P81_13945 [Holophagaceae bacterium]